MQFNENYGPMDIDEYDPNDEPVCVCADYVGSTDVTYCKSCMAFTDDANLLAPETIEAMLTNTNRVMSALYQAMDKKDAA